VLVGIQMVGILKKEIAFFIYPKILNQFVSAYKKLIIINLFLKITLLSLFLTSIQFLFMQTLKSLI